MKLTHHLLTFQMIASAMAAQLDINDKASVAKAHQAAAANLMSYYKPNDKGTITPVQSDGRNGFQWFEMGMLWGAMMDYTSISKDEKYFNTIAEGLGNAGSGSAASFIGPKEGGKWKSVGFWNDDIGWWSFGAISGAEIKGKDAKMPNGVPFLTLAKTTWEQIDENVDRVDNAPCKGGVFWHRDRQASKPNLARLLSTVTTLEYVLLGARIYETTGDQAMLKSAQDAFNWISSANLIGPNGEVYDGTYNPKCWQIEKKEHSYNAGLFLASAAKLFKVTNDQRYMNDASKVFSRFQSVFTKDGIIIDECEPTNSCKVNQAAFKGIAVRGLGHYYQVVQDQQIRSSIQTLIQKTAQGMAATCNDQWACNMVWTPGSPAYSDVHTQNTALELLNALSIVSGGEVKPTGQQQTQPSQDTTQPPPQQTQPAQQPQQTAEPVTKVETTSLSNPTGDGTDIPLSDDGLTITSKGAISIFLAYLYLMG